MLRSAAAIVIAVTVGIAFDWAVWSRLMQYLDPDHYQPERLRWRDTVFPRVLLLVIASVGMGIESRHPFVVLRYLSMTVFVIGTAWGVLLAWRRLRQS
jgi:hypothetical protein